MLNDWHERVYGKQAARVTEKRVRFAVAYRLQASDREQAQAQAANIFTPSHARAWALHNSSWSVRQVDGLGHYFLLKYKGCDIKLIARKQMIDEPYDPEMPLPGPVIVNEMQEYIGVDLIEGALQRPTDDTEKLNVAQRKLDGLRSSMASLQDRLVEMAGETSQYKSFAELVVDENGKLKIRLAALEEEQVAVTARGKQRERAANAQGVEQGLKTVLVTADALHKQLQREPSEWLVSAFAALRSSLMAQGAELIAPAVGSTFDPTEQQAVDVLVIDGVPEGQIVEVSHIGLRHGGKIIKAADVIVSGACASAPESLSGALTAPVMAVDVPSVSVPETEEVNE